GRRRAGLHSDQRLRRVGPDDGHHWVRRRQLPVQRRPAPRRL
ncbi:MAG: hypothetical protein AVDCRST_MAG73-4227, partial [uncultured Thermomicrobiales bacterium]